MTNARSIISQAARKIAVLGRGQTMSADEYQDALTSLNSMMSTLSTNTGLIFNNSRETFTLTGAASYTVGVGQTFNTTAPILISAAYITIGDVNYPLRQLNDQEYAEIPFKTLTGIPDSFYYNKDSPIATIFIYPIGTSGYSFTMSSLKPFDAFADLTTDYSLPPGGEDMLAYNLAKRLCAEYENPVPSEVRQMAEKSLRNIEAYNKRNNYPRSQLDLAENGVGGNIYSGWCIR